MWVNNYLAYLAGPAFGGCKSSGIGRGSHAMMRDCYRQTKNLLVGYNENTHGFVNADLRNPSAVSPLGPSS